MQTNSSQDMPEKAIILAGGFGTRLRPAVDDRPKVLAPAAGKPFIEYLLAYLEYQGIKHVILSVGYLGELVQAEVGSGSRWGLVIEYVIEKEPLGTGGALKYSSLGVQGPFFALNGDTLFQVSLLKLWQCHKNHRAIATMSLRTIPWVERDDYHQRGCVTMDSYGNIRGFDEKPGPARDPSPFSGSSDDILTNGGIYVLTHEALASLETGQVASIERDVFPALAAKGQLAGCLQSGYFIDIGTPQSLALFELDIRNGIFTA